jgi:uncharacterized ferredoxin-like protein
MEVLMSFLPSLVNALAVAVAGLFIWYITRSQSEQLAHRMDRLEDRIDNRFDQVDARIVRLESDIAAVRSDLTHVALAVGARTRPQTG